MQVAVRDDKQVCTVAHYIVRRVSVWGAQGACPPPLEIEKHKKIELFHRYFATFLVGNIIFSAIFWTAPPPLKIEKQKNKQKKALRIAGHATDCNSSVVSYASLKILLEVFKLLFDIVYKIIKFIVM